MPREGTETKVALCVENTFLSFGNKMPREGTETVYSEKTISKSYRHLEIRCPERGRKLISFTNVFIFHKFGNKMPREGTETVYCRKQTVIGEIIWK